MDREEEFLFTFFTNITQLCFDKAKESVEKEKESYKSTQAGPWGMLLMHLPQIAAAEKSYIDLGFLHTKNKGFLRKDNSLKTIYDSLRSDLRRVEEVTRGTNIAGSSTAELASQLCQYIVSRIQLIEFYEKLYAMGNSNKVIRYQDLLVNIEQIIENHSQSCSHSSLDSIRANIKLESEVLMHLIKSHIELQYLRFLPSLMSLNGVHTRMLSWERTLQNKDTWKLGFGATFLKTNQLPALYQWLIKWKSAIFAKFSLYFYTVLSQQTTYSEMRNILSKLNTDYYHRLQNIQKKLDVPGIIIVFDSRQVQDSGPGYKHPMRKTTTSEDLRPVLTIPQTFSLLYHWENIKKHFACRCSDLKPMDKVIFSKNQTDLWTYAMFNIEPRITFIIAYENYTKQKDKDSYITAFIQDLNTQIRCTKIFESLKLSK